MIYRVHMTHVSYMMNVYYKFFYVEYSFYFILSFIFSFRKAAALLKKFVFSYFRSFEKSGAQIAGVWKGIQKFERNLVTAQSRFISRIENKNWNSCECVSLAHYISQYIGRVQQKKQLRVQ